MDCLTDCLEVARQAAHEAGRMLKANIGARRDVVFKGAVDLVTQFDKRAQDIIHRRLSSAFPDHGFLAEEGLAVEGRGDYRWIFDPLDGTTNYAHGLPVFCVSIALEHRGRLAAGVVYDPMREETFWAAMGSGAFLNGSRIRVSTVDDLDKSLLATGFPYDVRDSDVNNVLQFNAFIMRTQAVRRCGSAALDLCYVACGRFDGFWELKLKPWDMAAGALIILESGGMASDFEGNAFNPFHPEALASNGLIHEQMKKILLDCRKTTP